jgi:DNA-binding transcriptional ArsR family regulator
MGARPIFPLKEPIERLTDQRVSGNLPLVMTYQAALQALADPTRRAVFERLRDGPMPVGELAADLPVTRPAVSQHLKVLRNAGLVQERKVGTRRIYGVELDGLAELRRYLDAFWTDVLAAFEAHVRNEHDTDAGEEQR